MLPTKVVRKCVSQVAYTIFTMTEAHQNVQYHFMVVCRKTKLTAVHIVMRQSDRPARTQSWVISKSIIKFEKTFFSYGHIMFSLHFPSNIRYVWTVTLITLTIMLLQGEKIANCVILLQILTEEMYHSRPFKNW